MGIEIKITGSSALEALSTMASAASYCMQIPVVAATAKDMTNAAEAAMKPGPHSSTAAPAPVLASGVAPAPSSAPVRGKNPAPSGVAPVASPVAAPAAGAPPAGMFSPVQQNQPQYSPSFGAPVNPTAGAGQNPVMTSPSDPQQVLPGMGPVTPAPGLGAGPLPVSNAPGFTAEQVSKAGADLVTTNPAMRSEMQKLFQQYGVQSMTELKPEQLGPFALALRGLGAKI